MNCKQTEWRKFCSDEEMANSIYQLAYLLAKPVLVLLKCNLSKYGSLFLYYLLFTIHIICICLITPPETKKKGLVKDILKCDNNDWGNTIKDYAEDNKW